MSLRDWFDYGTALGRGEVSLRVGQTQTVLTVIVLGLIIVLGILIYSEVQTAVFPDITNDFANQSETENAAFNATGDFGDSMELAPVIMIVLIAAVVLGVVQRFQA